MQEARLEAEDAAVVAEPDRDVVDLAALLGGADEVLAPVLGPLDRHAQPVGGEGDEDLLGIELDHLDAEAAADVGGDDLHLLEAEVEQQAEAGADTGRGLRRVVHQQPALVVEAGDDRAGLERHRSAALDVEVPAEHVVRRGQSGVDVAVLLGDAAHHVVGPVAVHQRRVRLGGAREVGDDRQRLVLDADGAGGVLGDVAVLGHDHGDDLADVADLVLGERVLRAGGDDRLVRDDQRQRVREPALEVLVGVDGVDAFDGERAGDVDVDDAGVRVVRAHEGGVGGMGREVVGVAAVAGEQTPVLAALDALAEAHRSSSSAAAARTARTIPT